MTDLGLNSPASDLVLFFIPRPILRIMTEAEEAVEEMERLSVEPPNILGPYMLLPIPAASCCCAIRACSASNGSLEF